MKEWRWLDRPLAGLLLALAGGESLPSLLLEPLPKFLAVHPVDAAGGDDQVVVARLWLPGVRPDVLARARVPVSTIAFS